MTRNSIPRDRENDHSAQAASTRREFLREQVGSSLDHVGSFSFEAESTRGNIENFIGTAQVPIGIAGPLLVNGEHATGEFYVPLATTEGALVASYNRGMRVIHESGGATVTISQDHMQRSPAFLFASAREARDFGIWVDHALEKIREVAESTTSVGKLEGITQFAVGPNLYCRFDYSTGDAAGQNMVSKATLAACQWIKSNYLYPCDFMLSGNIDTDKKHSQINTLLTRGKRVVAEVTTSAETLQRLVGVSPKDLFKARQISQAGAFMAVQLTMGPTLRTVLRRFLLPPAKTLQILPNPMAACFTRNYSTMATTTGRSPSPRSSWQHSAAGPGLPPSASALNSWGAPVLAPLKNLPK